MNTPLTTWPTRREHLSWGTRDLQTVREYADADDVQLAALARRLGRSFLSVRTRRLRQRQQA